MMMGIGSGTGVIVDTGRMVYDLADNPDLRLAGSGNIIRYGEDEALVLKVQTFEGVRGGISLVRRRDESKLLRNYLYFNLNSGGLINRSPVSTLISSDSGTRYEALDFALKRVGL